ncbi:hypothetical protein DPMN_088170 [Dreissena polymorpha]|uniref:Uncharacterized protein n=1 Tax=Dreissena polymorpha TaxID=45954 RepID=A0A9D4QXM4_DREPO|nr:hypothetical protein DPMN_088170 [Dreissena polymorpha]
MSLLLHGQTYLPDVPIWAGHSRFWDVCPVADLSIYLYCLSNAPGPLAGIIDDCRTNGTRSIGTQCFFANTDMPTVRGDKFTGCRLSAYAKKHWVPIDRVPFVEEEVEVLSIG